MPSLPDVLEFIARLYRRCPEAFKCMDDYFMCVNTSVRSYGHVVKVEASLKCYEKFRGCIKEKCNVWL